MAKQRAERNLPKFPQNTQRERERERARQRKTERERDKNPLDFLINSGIN